MKRYAIFLLFLLLPGLLAFSPPQQSNEIILRVDSGIGGWYRAGQWVPLLITVESDSRTVDGQLQVRVASSSTTSATQFETTYRSPFTIAAGDSKRVFLYVSLNDFAREVQVELLDNQSGVVAVERADVTQLAYDDILHAVVTESTTGILDVSRHPIGRGQNIQTSWQLDEIPPNPNALRSLDVLYFTDVDTGQLTTDQRNAITDWVASGGHLVVTGGPNWQRTTSGLSDLLPVTLQETATLDDITALGEFLRRDAEDLQASTLVVRSTPKDNARVMLEAHNVPLLVRGTLGSGTIDFVAFDDSVEPLRSWNDLSYLWHELTLNANPRPSWSHGIEQFNLARDAVSNVSGFDLPSILQLSAFLMVYIALMGPVNYFALSVFKGRELAWFTIPVFIVVFTAFAYFTGFSIRGDDVTINQVSVVQIWPDYDRARVDGAVGILSPRRTTYDVIIRDDLDLRTIPNVSGPASINQMTILQAEDYIAEDIPVDAAIMTSFATSGYIDAPDFSGEAVWTLRSGNLNTRLVGNVTHNLPGVLEDAVILASDAAISLGDLEPGARENFSIVLPLDQPPRVTLGSRVDPSHPVLMPSYGRNTSFDRAICYVSNGPNVVYQNVMQGQEFTCGGGGDDEALKIRRRALILAAINNEIDRNGGRGNSVYLLGWTQTPPLTVEIPDTGQVVDGTMLYIYEIPSRIESTNTSRIVVPPEWVTWTLIEQNQPNRLPEIAPDLSFQLTAEQGVALRFTPLANLPLDEVTQVDLEINWRFNTADVMISLWNWQGESWQPLEIFSENQTHFVITDEEYIGPQNAVQILVESQSAVSFQTINGMTVTMRGSG